MFYAIIILQIIIGMEKLYEYNVLAQNNGYRLRKNTRIRNQYLQTVGIGTVFFAFESVALFWSYAHVFSLVFAGVVALIFFLACLKRRTKMQWTKRGFWTFAVSVSLYLLVSIIIIFSHEQKKTPFVLCLEWLLLPLFWEGTYFLQRYFERKNDRFIKRQSIAVQEKGVKIIGITGSYGKTSCKNILQHFLSVNHTVLCTQKNYNTPMGVSIASQQRTGKEEFFICEFGARKAGDIVTLCRYFPPTYGIITGVCEQHLATFANIDAVYKEKFSLTQFIRDGFCVFGQNPSAKRMVRACTCPKISIGKEYNLWAESIENRVGKTGFYLCFDNEKRWVETNLLGESGVEDILICLQFVLALGEDREEMIKMIASIPPIPHRLEYKKANGVHILDDGYNGNEEGIDRALEILSAYPKPRIIVAQGIVEAGIKQKEKNRMIGEKISSLFDVVVLCGVNARSIEKGMEKACFSGKIVRCKNIKEVTARLKTLVRKGATVYLQNDVPDIY